MTNVVDLSERAKRAKVPQADRRIITRHDISQIMFEPVTVLADAAGRVLVANAQYGKVYLYIEENVAPKSKALLSFRGFRCFGEVTQRLPEGAQYLCSVFEGSDHAHIYLVAGEPVEG